MGSSTVLPAVVNKIKVWRSFHYLASIS